MFFTSGLTNYNLNKVREFCVLQYWYINNMIRTFTYKVYYYPWTTKNKLYYQSKQESYD